MNPWTSYNSLTASTQINLSTVMSAFDTAFDDPKETPAPGTDGEGNLRMGNDGLNLDDDADNEVEKDQRPSSYNPLNPFDTAHEFFLYSDRSSQADKKLMYHIQRGNKSKGVGINSIGHIVECSNSKIDQVLAMVTSLAGEVSALKIMVSSL